MKISASHAAHKQFLTLKQILKKDKDKIFYFLKIISFFSQKIAVRETASDISKKCQDISNHFFQSSLCLYFIWKVHSAFSTIPLPPTQPWLCYREGDSESD